MSFKLNISILALIIILGQAEASFDFSGKAFLNQYQKIDEPSKSASSSLEIQLLGKKKFSTSQEISGQVSLWHYQKTLSGQSNVNEAELRELYWRRFVETSSIKIGRFIHRWGKADIFSPLDVLIARNQTIFISDEDRQLAAPGATLFYSNNISNDKKVCTRYKRFRRKVKVKRKGKIYYKIKRYKKCTAYRLKKTPGLYNYELIANLAPAKHNIDFDAFTQGFKVSEEDEKERWKNIEFGIKIGKADPAYGWNLYAFSGRSKSPYIKFVEDSNFSEIQIFYPKKYLLGIDLEVPFASWVIRLDGAFSRGEQQDFDPVGENQALNTTLVFEHRINENFRWSIYPSLRYIVNFQSPEQVAASPKYDLSEKMLYSTNSAFNNYSKKIIYSTGLRIGYENDTLTHRSSLLAIYNITNKDSYINWDYKYALSDTFDIGGGISLYDGPSGTTFGSLKEKKSFFLTLGYWF